ncbi:MAG TPA: secondary thiamine-phosphate synthase enzyme YjbQ [Candidatus Limnocylindrales bacterium]|nr:secondary thiamine-phosphate synthase enzyme YjbQ [Candidatus Limnocylindrales bacterium]
MRVFHELIPLKTQECLQFVDLTDIIIELVEKSQIQNGFVNVQTKHTTTAIVINENEPLLLEDMKKILENIVPQDAVYRHNDFSIRTVNMGPEEYDNGHSHCKAMLLRASETLNLVNGQIQLGPWQRIFFIELDRARERTISVMVLGI